MVPDVEFTSYYGRPVVKAPPWKHEVPAYLFLGGVAGGSGLIALGAQLTGLEALRRNAASVDSSRSVSAARRWCAIWAARSVSTTCCAPSR